MKIFCVTPINKEDKDLFPSFVETFKSEGHSFTRNIDEANVVFFDMFSHLFPYYTREVDAILYKRLPVIFFDSSDMGGCKDGTEEWFGFKEPIDYSNIPQSQNTYWKILGMNKIVYFMRKMDKTLTYPSYVHPYELNYYEDCVHPIVTMDELFNREYDICFIGNNSYERKSVTEELSQHFKCDFQVGEEKIPHNQWLTRHKNAKMFLTCDGGGMSDERVHQLFSISTCLRQSNNQLILHNLRDGLECVEVSVNPTEDEIKYLKSVLTDKDILWQIYTGAIRRINRYFNKNYRSQYILDTLKKEGVC